MGIFFAETAQIKAAQKTPGRIAGCSEGQIDEKRKELESAPAFDRRQTTIVKKKNTLQFRGGSSATGQQTIEERNESLEICDSFLAYKSRNSNADNPLMSLQFNEILKVNNISKDGVQSSRKIIMDRLHIKA